MRSEGDVFGSLIEWAFSNENIRAIVINGSRGDPSRKPDLFSDYDAAVFVSDLKAIRNDQWLSRFGEVMVRWPLQPAETLGPDWITQLVLFQDGVRIDFQFTVTTTCEIERFGPFHCILVDKDRLSDRLYGLPVSGTKIQLPTEEDFVERINAFWWDIPYVAKALARGELDYARYLLESDLRFNKLHPLMRWHIALEHGPDTDTGLFGRWFQRYLPEDLWLSYLETYSGADTRDQWRAMFAMADFTGVVGSAIAVKLGFSYPEQTARNVLEYLHSISDSADGQEESG
jgi:aminoglycoside 6-adenylyltransferase